jgi:thiol-disulfide isomerase/thioredoxin
MKILNLFLSVMLVMFLTSCGKKEQNTKVEEKKTDVTQQNKQTENKSGMQIYKISAVEESKAEKTIPNMTWDEGSNKVSMSDYKGKVLFINFWATWCGPCKKEMPELSEINTELKDKDFKMFGVNVFQKGNTTIEDILKTIPVTYPILDGNDQVVKVFEKASGAPMDGVPTTFIVDKNGKIVETLVGSRDKAAFMTIIKKYL